ncbi:MAG: hypothetical protein AAB417_04155 [Patescibacteria group bacterium]
MIRKILFYGGIVLIIILILGGMNKESDPDEPDLSGKTVKLDPPTSTTRSFHLGFTRWPPDFSAQAIDDMWKFIGEHGDLLAHHYDAGVPWPEAYADSAFSKHVMDDWNLSKSKTPAGHAVYVAITPLADSRDAMAKYLGSADNMAIPAPWNTYALDSMEVKRAYTNYAKRIVAHYQPNYLVIGIEVNVALTKDESAWRAYKELHKHTYAELKKLYPNLLISASFSLPHLEGLPNGSDKTAQEQEIRSLLPYLDYIALSAYPYGWEYTGGKLSPVPDSYFDTALAFGKPLAIAETGMPSQNFRAYLMNWEFTEAEQTQYINMLLRTAQQKKFLFITNWSSIDSDKLAASFPPIVRDFANFFAYTGLQKSDGTPKKSLEVWDLYNAQSYRR